jgi:hypothetical protein
MNRTCLFVAIATLAWIGTEAAARPRPVGRTKRFEANKTFGLGLELGAPFGLTGKYFYSSDKAFDFGVGDIDYYVGDRYGFHIYGDHLWHPASLASTEPFELPFYIGVGLRLWDFNEHINAPDNGFALGVRVPIGIAFDFNDVPLDVFVQLTPVLDFAFNYRESAFFGIDGSVGIRYWFN